MSDPQKRPLIRTCPFCAGDLRIERLRCGDCNTAVEGWFTLSKLADMPADMQNFVMTFLECRGNIKEVEKALGVSYPTVRKQIDQVEAFVSAPGPMEGGLTEREVLDRIESGALSAKEGAKLLRKLRG
jgi:hypothetical protein